MTQQSLTELMFQLQRSAILMHRGRHKRPQGPMGGPWCGGPMGGHREDPMSRPPMEGPMRPDDQGLPPMRGQGLLLGFLLEEDNVPLKDLVEKMDIRPSSLSELVRKLQRAGLVETQEDEQDRRSVRVRLTEEGRKRAQELNSARDEKLSAMFSGLTEEEQQSLLALLTKLNESLAQKVGEEEGPRRGAEDHPHGFRGGPRSFEGGPWVARERRKAFFAGPEGPEEIIELEI